MFSPGSPWFVKLSGLVFITFAPESRAVPNSTMKILIDNGHGIQTKGKRSPDGKLLEYAYTRDLARQIVKILKSRGCDAEPLVLEDDDISLSERVRRVNATCLLLGK